MGGATRAAVVGAMVALSALLSACVPPVPDPGPPPTTAPAPCNTVHEVALGGGQGRGASVDASGELVAYLLGSTVRLRNTLTGSDVAVGSDLPAAQSYQHLKLSSDGTRIGVVGQSSGSPARRAWMIDVASATSTELDWSAVDWPNWTASRGFSDDLSAFVTQQFGSDQVRIISTDGSPTRFITLPSSGNSDGPIDGDASAVAAGMRVWRDGDVLTYPGASGPWSSIVDLNRAGDRALVSTEAGTFVWHLVDGTLEQVAVGPGEVQPDTGWAQMSEDASFVVRAATATLDDQDANYVVWRIDRATGAATALPPIFDGVTGISDDGRVMTSTNSQIFVCS